MLWAGWAWSSRRAEVTHDDISYSFSGSCWCSHFLSQDLHVSQGAVDSSVDMDRLNRNMPECARQTRQVLQVSVFLLGVGEGASDWEREGLIVPKWFSIHGRKLLSNVPMVSLSRVDPFSHSECSHLLTTVPIDVECHHTDCLGSALSLEPSIIMINTERGSGSGQAAQLGHVLTAYVTVL